MCANYAFEPTIIQRRMNLMVTEEFNGENSLLIC
jgi:hypothetical protein